MTKVMAWIPPQTDSKAEILCFLLNELLKCLKFGVWNSLSQENA